MILLKTYKLMGDRVYRIYDTEQPYELGYPDVEGTTHHTDDTGFLIKSKLPSGNWTPICSCMSLEAAEDTLLKFARVYFKSKDAKQRYLNEHLMEDTL